MAATTKVQQGELLSTAPAPTKARGSNPMIALKGQGPATTCKGCAHLVRNEPGANSYYKCRLRGITNGPGTDHRVNYDACGAFLTLPASGHTFQPDWHSHIQKPTVLNSATGITCPSCGLILGLRKAQGSYRVVYGLSERFEYEQEIARCPMAGEKKAANT